LAIRDRHHRIPPTPLTQDQLDVDRLVDAFVIAAQDEITISLTAAGDIIIEQHDAVAKPPDTILVRAGNVHRFIDFLTDLANGRGRLDSAHAEDAEQDPSPIEEGALIETRAHCAEAPRPHRGRAHAPSSRTSRVGPAEHRQQRKRLRIREGGHALPIARKAIASPGADGADRREHDRRGTSRRAPDVEHAVNTLTAARTATATQAALQVRCAEEHLLARTQFRKYRWTLPHGEQDERRGHQIGRRSSAVMMK
jgi:hypothetical protein